MKKIFAIALALVMVLSMASAFASYCTAGFDWTCATSDNYCGKATVEVVPYVATNAACDDVSFVESDCAAAINGENVHYALRLTVAEDIDPEWWAEVDVKLTVKGMTTDIDKKLKDIDLTLPKYADDSEDGWVFYFDIADNKWYEATENDEFDIADVMNTSVVAKYSKAKVCLTLTSDMDAENGFAGIVGDYYVVYGPAQEAVEETLPTIISTFEGQVNVKVTDNNWKLVAVDYDAASGKTVAVAERKEQNLELTKVNGTVIKTEDGKNPAKQEFFAGTPAVAAAGEVLTVYAEEGGKALVKYTVVDGKIRTIKNTPVCGEAAYATIKDFFGLEIGTCVDKDLIAANFGWDDEVKSCYAWKTQNAVAIVDTECVVAIPKTGDASVLAWLF